MLRLLVFLALIQTSVLPQLMPRLQWLNIYNGPGNGGDFIRDAWGDGTGHTYIVSSSGGLAGRDLLLIKYSPAGEVLFETRYATYNGSSNDGASLVVNEQQQVYVVGQSTFQTNSYFALLNKYDVDGSLIWTRDYYHGFNQNSEAGCIALDQRGRPVIGFQRYPGGLIAAAQISLITTDGDSLWTVSIQDDSTAYEVRRIAVDQQNHFYAYLDKYCFDGGHTPVISTVVVRISPRGDLLWQKEMPGDFARQIILDRQQNLVLITHGDGRIVKMDRDGNIVWERDYTNSSSYVPLLTAVRITTDNQIVVTGYGGGIGGFDFKTQKLTAGGEEIWIQSFNSEDSLKDFAHDLVIDTQGNVYVTGSSSNSISMGYGNIVKYSADGQQLWSYKLDHPAGNFDDARFIFLDDSTNLYLSGDISDTASSQNLLTFKIEQTVRVGVSAPDNRLPHEMQLFQNYPNPFNPSTTIEFQLPRASVVLMEIFDNIGRRVVGALRAVTQPGTHQYVWNGTDARGNPVASGVYYYRLTDGDRVLTRKALLIR